MTRGKARGLVLLAPRRGAMLEPPKGDWDSPLCKRGARGDLNASYFQPPLEIPLNPPFTKGEAVCDAACLD
jgi:hypothetical protein